MIDFLITLQVVESFSVDYVAAAVGTYYFVGFLKLVVGSENFAADLLSAVEYAVALCTVVVVVVVEPHLWSCFVIFDFELTGVDLVLCLLL